MNNTGGPAFPWCGDLNECPTINLGMTLRDYFAAMALHGFIKEEFTQPTYEQMAKACYELADAMLAAREQK